MATISIPKNYQDGDPLFESDLDDIRNAVEDFLNITKINDDNIQDDGITGSTKIIDGTVTESILGTDAVTTVKIDDLAVTTAKIADGAVTEDKLNTSTAGDGLAGGGGTPYAVNVDDSTIEIDTDTLRVKDLGITREKQEAVGQQISSSSGAFNDASGSVVDVTNLSVTITTSGRPVMVFLQSDASVSRASLGGSLTSAETFINVGFQILRDAVLIAKVVLKGENFTSSSGNELEVPPSALAVLDTPIAGTYVYKVQAERVGSNNRVEVNRCVLVAYEL